MPLILAGLVVGLLVVVGFILLIVPGLFLLTIFAVVAPVIVIERAGRLRGAGPLPGSWSRATAGTCSA